MVDQMFVSYSLLLIASQAVHSSPIALQAQPVKLHFSRNRIPLTDESIS